MSAARFTTHSANTASSCSTVGRPNPQAKYNADECKEKWRGVRSLTEFTAGTIFYFADEADPGWRDRYEDEERQRIFERMAQALGPALRTELAPQARARVPGPAGAGSSAGAGASSGAGAGSAGTAPPNPPLISATPFVLRDPKSLPKRQWLYGHHLIRKFGSATIALGAVGKSSLIIVEALAHGDRPRAARRQPPQRARVWLWNGEDPHGGNSTGASAAACLHFGITHQEIEGWLFVD